MGGRIDCPDARAKGYKPTMTTSPVVDDITIGDERELYLVRPEEPTGPAIVYLHWFDEAPDANRTQYLDEARAMATHGVVSVLPQLSFPWHTAPTDIDNDLERIDREVEFLVGVHDMVAKIDGVEPSRVAVVGHDFGAMYGALLMRSVAVRCAVLVAPTPRWSDWFLRFWPITSDRYDYMRALHRVDPIVAIGEANCPLLFQFGTTDFYIAPMTASELFSAAPEPKTLLKYDGGHVMELAEIGADRARFLEEHLEIYG